MPPLPVSLSPPKGQALVLTDNETWIGRTSFKLTWDGQLLCSRRQACLKITNTAVTLECHGVNPMYFVVCHSVNFQASEDTPPSMLHPLRRGEEVEVVDGDKFFLVLKECLLTVGIKPSKSDGDVAAAAAAVQPTPGTVHFNILDGRSLPDQVCSLETTQLVPASTCSPVEHNCFVCPSDESCKCSGVRNPPSGLQGPLVKDSPARQVTFSNTATSGHPISREVVTDIRRSTDASKSTVVSDDQPAAPEFSRLDSSGARDLLNLTSGGTVAPGSSVEGKGCGSSNDASKGILVPFFQPGTLNCGLDPIGPSTTVNCQADAQEACKQITTSSIYGRASSPPLAASGDPAPCGITINNRWPIGASQTAIVPYDGHVPELLRLDSSPTGGPSVNSTQGCTVATSSSVEGRGRVLGPSNDTVGESLVQSIYLDNVAYGLDSRGTAEPVAKSFVDAHEAGQQIGTRNVSSCTSSPLCPELNRIQDDMPCAVTSGLDPHQGPTLPRQLSLVQGNNTQSDFPPEAVSSPQSPSLDGVSSGLAMTIHERRELSLKQPEIVDLTGSKDEIDAQAQIQSESVQVGHAVCNNLRDPIEGMENIIVTISGYNDVLRSRLINLISVTGASYTGSLTNINTHVVCWKFRGEKYEMAKKLGKSIVNHCWFEDCRKAGMRLPEGLYRASGKVAAPLCWDRSSSMQHPPSTAGFDHDQDCNSLPLKEHSLGQARPAPVIGCPSTDTGKRGEISCRSALLSRNENGMLDRGKRHVDLDSSANRLQGGNLRTIAHDCQDARQVTPLARSGNSGNFPATNLSTSHHAEQDESDEFWNEAFREYDDRNNQVSEHSCEVSSNANHRAGLMERRTGMRRPAASPSPGSSLRDLDPEIRSGTRDALANEAGSSGVAQGEIHQEAMPSPSVGEQSDDVHSETDHIIGYPEVFRRKRKRASASTVLGDSPNQVGGVASAIKWVVIAGRPTPLSSDAAQERASTLDTKDDRQQIAGVIDAESVGKAEEKRGESASSNEIACVICHSDTKAINEGVLACGHQFCYPCIQRWADEARSRTCPLCKVPFDFITFREMGKAGEDGSRTVLEERIVQLSHQRVQETGLTNRSMLRSERCVRCGSADTPELFLICTPCGERACHSFCLDPPRPPGSFWSCARCSRMRFTTETRDTYGRIFQGGQSSARRRQDIPDVGMSLAQQSRTSNRGGALVRHQSSATPLRLNLAPQRGSTSHVGGLAPGQSSDTAPRRARQHSLHKFLVRQNDV